MKDLDKRLSGLERAAAQRRVDASGTIPMFICEGPDDEARVNAEIALLPERGDRPRAIIMRIVDPAAKGGTVR